MRQVLSVRFLVALGALVLAGLLAYAFVASGRTSAELLAPILGNERQPELIAQVLAADVPGLAINDTGQATVDAVLTLAPDERTVRIFAGTPGEISCTELGSIGGCALLAELLGDTVTWFALVPMTESFRFQLPPIEDLDGGLAHLTNGWAVPYAPVIDRSRCANPGESFGDFLRTVGDDHLSLYDLGDAQITAVLCPNNPAD